MYVPGPYYTMRLADLGEELRALFLSRTQSEWHELGLEVDCCLTAVEETDTLLDNPFWLGRDLLNEQGKGDWGGILQIRSTLNGTNEQISPPPNLGRDTWQVLRERLRFTEQQLQSYESRGLIGTGKNGEGE